MRWVSILGLTALTVPAFSGEASANPLHRPLCCGHRGQTQQFVPLAPMTFGTTGFGIVGFSSVGFGTVGFGVPAFGSYGCVPMTLGGNGGGNGTGFGAADGFGVDPAPISLLAGLGIDIVKIVREARSKSGGGALPPPLPGGIPAATTAADLAGINQKLDAIIVNQAVSTAAVLKPIAASEKKVDGMVEQLKLIKAKTDTIK